MVTLQIKGLDELIRICGTDLGPTFRAILHGVGELVRNEVARAPGPVHKPINWASDKQRRFYFASRRSGKTFMGPWKRESDPQSQRLIASWTVHTDDDYHVTVGNKTTYGPWVQGWFDQQLMHKQTGWVTDDQAVKLVEGSGDIERIAGMAIEHVLSGR